jgi:hypothetical protein
LASPERPDLEAQVKPVLSGIVQLCQVTRDLDRSIATWIGLYGAGPFFVAEFRLEGHHYRGQPVTSDSRIGLAFCGGLLIELAQPKGAGPSILHEVLEARGEALHHIWKPSRDFDAEVARFAAQGCPVIAGGPIPGMGRQVYIDTTAHNGVYTELLELAEWVYGALDVMRQAHLGWDGSDPVRPYPVPAEPRS